MMLARQLSWFDLFDSVSAKEMQICVVAKVISRQGMHARLWK